MPKLAPPFMPPHRIAEARDIATGGRWFQNCPEKRCRLAKSCRGELRRFRHGGPRCYPTCLKVVLESILAGHDSTPDQTEQYCEILAHDEAYWSVMEHGPGFGDLAPATPVLFYFMSVLAKPVAESAALSTAPSGQSNPAASP